MGRSRPTNEGRKRSVARDLVAPTLAAGLAAIGVATLVGGTTAGLQLPFVGGPDPSPATSGTEVAASRPEVGGYRVFSSGRPSANAWTIPVSGPGFGLLSLPVS